jgi:RNA polymerase sigma factor (sigma-70 family)
MRNAPKTRPSLILRLRNRDDLDAWQEFVAIYQPLVYRLAVRKGFQHNDAADIVQEVLLRVAGAIERWDPDDRLGTFRGWLHRIARNLMISFLEKKDRQPVIADHGSLAELLAIVPAADSLQSPEFDDELQRQVFHWVAGRVKSACEESTWQAFHQSAVEGIPIPDVARRLGISVGSVYVARSRVIRRLKEQIEHSDFNAKSAEAER